MTMRVPLMAVLSRGEFDAMNDIAKSVERRIQYDKAVAQDKRVRVAKRRVAVNKQEAR